MADELRHLTHLYVLDRARNEDFSRGGQGNPKIRPVEYRAHGLAIKGQLQDTFSDIDDERHSTSLSADELKALGLSLRHPCSAARPALNEMLEWIRTNRVDMVIVHKLDRLARSRADDVHITQAITDSGARLVSSTEAIDESPSGRLVHGIMASIAEFYSRNLATEVSKGLRQKAMNGGTPNKAPAVYRNVRTFDAQGREARIVEVDEERAQIIRWAFTTYATGEWSLHRLAHGMTQLGFTLPARMGKPTRELTVGSLQKILRNPYYCGIVTYCGVEYPGRHCLLYTSRCV